MTELITRLYYMVEDWIGQHDLRGEKINELETRQEALQEEIITANTTDKEGRRKQVANHIKAWDSTYAFNGEDEVINFFNEVTYVLLNILYHLHGK